MSKVIIKETRGRPAKYDFSLKIGELRTYPKKAQGSAMKYAARKGVKFRTWIEDNMVNVVRIAAILFFFNLNF